MYFKSIKDLSDDIEKWIPQLPAGIECVVGVPRSGMLVANILALKLNLPFTDLDGFLAGRMLGAGRRLQGAAEADFFSKVRHALVVDDCLSSGKSMREVRARVEAADGGNCVSYGCVYGMPGSGVDWCLFGAEVPKPRRFEWNILSTKEIENYCFDLDGVLCNDPAREENDDGERYLRFLQGAKPLYLPRYPIGAIVTSRLERYRAETEAWLAAHGIAYRKLLMLDLPTREDRVRTQAAIPFKAEAYRASGAELFIESDIRQAEAIARASGRYVYSVDVRRMIPPEGMAGYVQREGRALRRAVRSKLRSLRRRLPISGRVKTTG